MDRPIMILMTDPDLTGRTGTHIHSPTFLPEKAKRTNYLCGPRKIKI
jgi:hypothetical protein